MKSTSHCWKIVLMLLAVVASRCLAVNADTNPPCWRGGSGTTFQAWLFATNYFSISPEVVTNSSGSPLANITTNGNSAGWISTNGGIVFGTAQGIWDLGGTSESVPAPGNVLLTIPNSVSAGATRYVWVQTTAMVESGLYAHPTHIVSNATQIGSSVTTFAEGVHWDPDNELWVSAWYNRRTLWSVPATGNVATVYLRGASIGTVLDSVIVDTMLRLPAAIDTASTPRNVATNLTATLLANDGGPTLSVVGASTLTAAGAATSVGSGMVTYIPPTDYTGPDVFYYTNSDCAGGVAVAQVTVQVTGAGGPVVATDTFSRTQGLPLHISMTNLLGNDTGTGLTFAGLNLTSTNGATVTTNATTIFYTNPNNVDDRLTYYIRDNLNARAGGYVMIQMATATSSSTIVQLQTDVPGPDTNTLTLAGIPNYQYVVQFATNVEGSPWFNLSTNTAGGNGLWTVQDPTATNAQRYYRVTTP